MKVQDPVCGKQMDLGDVAASEDHEGWAYFFCSENCRTEFAAAPNRYAQDLEHACTAINATR